jgi:outer membrane protein
MRIPASILTLLVVLALAAGPALADEMVSLKVGYLTLSPEGEFAVSDGGVGTKVDMEDDLGFDDSEDFMAEVAIQLGSFRLSAAYLPLQFSGHGALNETVTFNGRDFDANIPLDSDVDIDLYDVGLTWYLLNFDDLPVRLQLGPELSVKYVDADLSMDNGTFSESDSVSAPVPTIGLRGRVGLSDFVGVVGRLGYVEYDSNTFLDADVQVEFSPLPLVGLFAGYRYFDLKVDESDVFLDVTFDGPYGGAFVRF